MRLPELIAGMCKRDEDEKLTAFSSWVEEHQASPATLATSFVGLPLTL